MNVWVCKEREEKRTKGKKLKCCWFMLSSSTVWLLETSAVLLAKCFSVARVSTPKSHSTPFQAFPLLTPQLQMTMTQQNPLKQISMRLFIDSADRANRKKIFFFSVFNKTISFPTSSPSSGLTSVRNHLMKPKQHLYACSGEWTLKTKVERKRKWRWIFREYNFRRAGCWAIPSSQFGSNVRTANWSIILRRALPIPIITFNALRKRQARDWNTRKTNEWTRW